MTTEGEMRLCARIWSSLALAFLAALLAMLPVAASAFSENDRAESRAVIERQIEAFRQDDGATAFAFASPGLQAIFQDQDRFMAMVKNGYQPVYRPRNYAFAGIAETDSGLTATLSIEDQDGHAWTAVYTLEKQPDGSWKITSCRLERVGVSA
jgi:Domain of unknown function (DUF4864)